MKNFRLFFLALTIGFFASCENEDLELDAVEATEAATVNQEPAARFRHEGIVRSRNWYAPFHTFEYCHNGNRWKDQYVHYTNLSINCSSYDVWNQFKNTFQNKWGTEIRDAANRWNRCYVSWESNQRWTNRVWSRPGCY